jgi:hypothetical protein
VKVEAPERKQREEIVFMSGSILQQLIGIARCRGRLAQNGSGRELRAEVDKGCIADTLMSKDFVRSNAQ